MYKNTKSKELFEKAIEIIPLWTQTFSKSYLSYYKWDIPHFIERWEWAYVWDIDGNKYIDFINWLLPVILWYNIKEINDKIIEQLQKWVIFSLSHPIEYELSKKLTEIIPSAEMVRFWKSWTDATSSSIRLARYITKREKIAVCGYHGWQDWYIGSTTRNGWVPKCIQELTFKFEYNNIESLEKIFNENKDELAAIIMEPMNLEFPKDNFLQKVQSLCKEHWALFILDETITGFRFGLWWAQWYFWITPDLSAFWKSMANGMPISALVWKREYIQKVEEIFFSGTYLWETLSMASAMATIEFIEKNNVSDILNSNWEYLRKWVTDLINKYWFEWAIEIVWHNSWQIFKFKDFNGIKAIQIKSFLQKELIEHGILWFWSFNMSYSHTKDIIDTALHIFDGAIENLKTAIEEWKIIDIIWWKEINDIFKVR